MLVKRPVRRDHVSQYTNERAGLHTCVDGVDNDHSESRVRARSNIDKETECARRLATHRLNPVRLRSKMTIRVVVRMMSTETATPNKADTSHCQDGTEVIASTAQLQKRGQLTLTCWKSARLRRILAQRCFDQLRSRGEAVPNSYVSTVAAMARSWSDMNTYTRRPLCSPTVRPGQL